MANLTKISLSPLSFLTKMSLLDWLKNIIFVGLMSKFAETKMSDKFLLRNWTQ